MSLDNIFIPTTGLQKPPKTEPGGLCSIIVFRKQDVLSWPNKDQETGYLATTVQLKPGKAFYLVQTTDKDRTFQEELKYGAEGPYCDISVTATVPGNTVANILSIEDMQFSEWGIIVHDRDGNSRLIGNVDSCARIFHKYTSGDPTTSRKRQITWQWSSSLPAPIYEAGSFEITIGGVTITAGALTLIMQFQVGKPGAPMNDGDASLVNAGFVNKNLLILANGTGLPIDDGSGNIDWTGSIVRRVEKTYADNELTFVGGVIQDEIIQIYAWS